jgi:hypothetical protein
MKRNALGRYLVIVSALALFGCGGSSATAPGSATSSAADSSTAGGTSSGGTGSSLTEKVASAFEPKPIIVSAGTKIMVTADQSVSSKTSNPGDHFDASLAAPINVDGKEVIPSGAKASGTVTDAKSAGKFNGNAAITVTLSSITVRGREYSVSTSSITEAGKGRGKRTAVGAGGGAAFGAIVGALAGGGKGAAIGAGAGAGAGTAGAAFTGDRDITIPAETKLNFKLKEAIEVKVN